MNNEIEKYLIDEKKVESEVVRKLLTEKVTKYDDIRDEFLKWLEVRNYDDMPLEVGGYTAKSVYKMAPMLDGIGVFNFLVTLRDDPEEAQRIIGEGFKVL